MITSSNGNARPIVSAMLGPSLAEPPALRLRIDDDDGARHHHARGVYAPPPTRTLNPSKFRRFRAARAPSGVARRRRGSERRGWRSVSLRASHRRGGAGLCRPRRSVRRRGSVRRPCAVRAPMRTFSAQPRWLAVVEPVSSARDEPRSMRVLRRAGRVRRRTSVRPPDIGSESQNDLWLTRLHTPIIRLPWPDRTCAVVN